MIGLRKARKARNWNQQKVAMDLNITREALSHYENGRREPSLAMLERMSDYFDVSIHYLITGREFEKRTETVYPK
ncbi:MAG: helix-turn-helix transcriptional regulator [Oscillospiraceae bacterium]|jgi:transcriptional regulator with XRE-family HTH domain|nr:helix-turn-helix transcriptional regulator [Oscillospiraceae bacterium]